MKKKISLQMIISIFVLFMIVMQGRANSNQPLLLDEPDGFVTSEASVDVAQVTKKKIRKKKVYAEPKAKDLVRGTVSATEDKSEDNEEAAEDTTATPEPESSEDAMIKSILEKEMDTETETTPQPVTEQVKETDTPPQVKEETKTEESFPEKTDFIVKEDEKAGIKLGETTAAATAATTPVKPVSTGSMFLKMILTTLALGLVVFGLALLWKWLQGRSGKIFPGSQKSLKVISQQVIGPKSKILIVEALGKKYLVGATDSNIQLLADIDFYEAGGEFVPGKSVAEKKTERSESFPAQESLFDADITEKRRLTSLLEDQVADQVAEMNQQNHTRASTRIKERLKRLKKLA